MNVKAVVAVTFLVLGLFTGINYMVDKEVGTNWLMWTLFFFLGALLFWLWMMREERSAEDAAEESLDAAEESLRRLEAQAAPAEAPSVPRSKAPDTTPKAVVGEAKPAPEPVAKTSTEPDDLTRVEGIGPKYAEILVAAGVDTFAKLAAIDEAVIVETIRKGGGRKSASMGTWAEQANLAAAGDWDGLAKLQAELSGGKR
jgi:predicted flap endonuclease-1-like 5' DNA nuclease